MKKKTKQVLSILKPKCKALGFNSSELEGIAADIADNLELDEEASEEDINEKISAEVDSVVPILKLPKRHPIVLFRTIRITNPTTTITTKMKPAKESQISHQKKLIKYPHGLRHSLHRIKLYRQN